MSDVTDVSTAMTDEISPQLLRYMARKIAGLDAAAWKALDTEEKASKIAATRGLLKSERNFLKRKVADNGGED